MNTYIIIIEFIFIFFLLFLFVKNSYVRQYSAQMQETVIISPDTSQVLKAVCCIIIVLHHFALRRQDITVLKPISMGGGNFALPIFFILSAYGIAKSELHKPINKFTGFLKKRRL